MVYCQLDNGFRFVYTLSILTQRMILSVRPNAYVYIFGHTVRLGKSIFEYMYIQIIVRFYVYGNNEQHFTVWSTLYWYNKAKADIVYAASLRFAFHG